MRVLSFWRLTYLRAGAGALAGTMLVRGAQRTAWGAAVGLVAALVELDVVLIMRRVASRSVISYSVRRVFGHKIARTSQPRW